MRVFAARLRAQAIGTGPRAGAEMNTDFPVVSVGYGWTF